MRKRAYVRKRDYVAHVPAVPPSDQNDIVGLLYRILSYYLRYIHIFRLSVNVLHQKKQILLTSFMENHIYEFFMETNFN